MRRSSGVLMYLIKKNTGIRDKRRRRETPTNAERRGEMPPCPWALPACLCPLCSAAQKRAHSWEKYYCHSSLGRHMNPWQRFLILIWTLIVFTCALESGMCVDGGNISAVLELRRLIEFSGMFIVISLIYFNSQIIWWEMFKFILKSLTFGLQNLVSWQIWAQSKTLLRSFPKL